MKNSIYLKNDKGGYVEIYTIQTGLNVNFKLKFTLKKSDLSKIKSSYISIMYNKYNGSIPNPYSFKQYILEGIKRGDIYYLISKNIYDEISKIF